MFWFRLAVVISILAVSACEGSICPPMTKFERAARYYVMSEGGYSKPLNTWVENSDLTDFVGDVLSRRGIGALETEYQFQCSRSTRANCPDCYSCTRTLPLIATMWVMLGPKCLPAGEMLMQVDIGPGSSARAMTYWNRKE
jgi:hypothetical protein